ncbi:hypothetical protein JHK87_000760 [Glycine soja]|nr:hypothetical protein JHK87_000760 [Glycine soja]
MYRPLPWPGPPSPGTPPHHLCHNFSHQESPQKLDSGGGDIIEGSGGVSILRDDEADEGGGFDAQAWIFQGLKISSLETQLPYFLPEIRKALKEGRKPTTSPPDGDEDLSVPYEFFKS